MIYLASSWRNKWYPGILAALRHLEFQVHDFRDPAGYFTWDQCGQGDYREWTFEAYKKALDSPGANTGFSRDMTGLLNSSTTVLVGPCGRSAHLELGWAVGAGKHTAVYFTEPQEPELMYKMVNLLTQSWHELIDFLKEVEH